jgi:hypothetical protein
MQLCLVPGIFQGNQLSAVGVASFAELAVSAATITSINVNIVGFMFLLS